jgi:hypothetical protein
MPPKKPTAARKPKAKGKARAAPAGPPPSSRFPSRPPRAAGAGPRPPVMRTAAERAEPQAPSHLLKLASPHPGEIRTVEADGPLLFLGGQVVMGNAAAGVSQIGLEIDGQLVQVVRADQLTARALTLANATGAFATHASFGNMWTVVLGWPYPLKVARQVKLSVMVMEPMGELELTLFLGK